MDERVWGGEGKDPFLCSYYIWFGFILLKHTHTHTQYTKQKKVLSQ
jgi:hypothetical protein